MEVPIGMRLRQAAEEEAKKSERRRLKKKEKKKRKRQEEDEDEEEEEEEEDHDDDDEGEKEDDAGDDDLDRRIAALERELEEDTEDEEEEEEEEEEVVVESLREVRDESGRVVSLASGLLDAEEAKIAALPSHLLPATSCGPSMTGKKPKKKKPKGAPKLSVNSELEAAVEETLRNYEPSGHRPLFCRCCQRQCSSLEEFEAHKRSEEHAIATEKERALSYCRLCRKQFTSPLQLENHLQGKAHREMAAKRIGRGGAGGFRGRGGGFRGGGRGGRGRGGRGRRGGGGRGIQYAA